jgi:hypothetical protein
VPHQQEAATAGPFDILRGCWVGHVTGVEAWPLVGDLDLKSIGGDLIDDPDVLGPVHLITVLDGVNERFFQSEANGENVVIGELAAQRLLNLRLDAPGLGQIACDR